MAKQDSATPKTPKAKNAKAIKPAKEACIQPVDMPADKAGLSQAVKRDATPCGIDTLSQAQRQRFIEILAQNKASRKPEDFDAEDALAIIDALDSKKLSYERQTQTIVEKFQAIRELAKALREMHDSKLYLLHFGTFEEYAKATCAYSRARAYQLVYADELIERIDREVGEGVIVNEYQTRALRRLKISDDDEKNIQAQINLVKELKDKEGKVTVQGINEAIDEIIAKAPSAQAPVPAYQVTLKKISTRYLKNFQRLYGNTPATEKDKMKEAYIKTLSALIKQLRGEGEEIKPAE